MTRPPLQAVHAATDAPALPRPAAVVDPGRRVPERPLWIALGVALLGVTLGGSAMAAWTNLTRQHAVLTATYAATGLELRDLGSIDVTIVGSDRNDIAVTRSLTWSGSADSPPAAREQVSGGILSVENPCRNSRFPCSANLHVEVPRAASIRWAAGSGDLTAQGVASVSGSAGSGDVVARDVGTVDITTSSGDIDLCRVALSLTVHTSSGGVDICDVDATQATVSTSSGDIHLDGTPGRLAVTSTSGDVVVTLGGSDSYDVRTSTKTGGVSVRARTDSTAPRVVEVTTTSGDITVR